MIMIYYNVMFLLSVLLTLGYVMIWHKHFDVHITAIFILVPISNLIFLIFAEAQNLEEVLIAQRLTYIGGLYLILMIMLVIFSMCNIRLKRWMSAMLYFITTVVFVTSQTIGKSDIFYKSVSFSRENGVAVLYKEYGFMHTVSRILIIVYLILSVVAVIYSYFWKNQVSNRMIVLLLIPVLIASFAFFAGRKLIPNVELIPAAYVFAQFVYIIIIYRVSIYDITDVTVDSMMKTGETGIVTCDFQFRYLGSNEFAKEVFPALNDISVDNQLNKSLKVANTISRWIKAFKDDETKNKVFYAKDDKVYLIAISFLYNGVRRRGYQIFITDDTKNQEYIKLINSYNERLSKDVAAKTKHIVEMHDNLILSMATMVESRDNSTGGHIRRTSIGVKLLIEEMRKDLTNELSDEFCHDIVKAAPMHDLGKIAVDDAILRKPGRFTPEEFDKMKTHAAEGARIVHEILKSTDDETFKKIAENVAHYHHERWDGSGYPDGLKGEQIPLESRIMAIADVYDALVSKRVYKEKMSFEKANAIIMEGMGTQFDKSLERYYVSARPELEKYYSSFE